MYQDEKGYLWSGGYGGLSRFDGKQFINYNRKNGLIDHNVNAICDDNLGNIFVGTNKGLSILRDKKFTNYHQANGLINPFITSFCKGNDNSIYFGTNMGLYKFHDHKIKLIKKLAKYKINCIYNSNTGIIFVGTDKGLILYEQDTYSILNKANGLVSDRITSITKFKNYLVIGTLEGLTFYDLRTKRCTNFTAQNGLIDENITSLLNQDDKSLWIGSASGLLYYDGSQFNYYGIAADNNSNHIQSVLKDKENNIWLGTHTGLYRYRDNSFSTFDKVNGLGNSFIFQIFRDTKGDLWVTSQSNGIYRETQNYFKRYGVAEGLKSNTIRSGLEDKDGRLLFGTTDGVAQFIGERFVSVAMPRELKGPFDVMFKASNNTVWIGGTNGVASLVWKNNIPETKFFPILAQNDFAVYGFCEDNEGNLYAGTYKAGLQKLVNGVFINWSSKLNLNEENFFTIKYLKGNIYCASLNGLLILNTQNNSLKKISDADGLNSDLIYSLEFSEGNNSLWIGTNQGINKLNLKKYLSEGKVEISSFGKLEGFAGVECNSNGIWEDKDGTLWFGTVNGLIKHQPSKFKRNGIENPTLIQNIKVLNEDTALEENVLLPSDHNTISFYYRGICLTNPEKVLYQKKLIGLDEDKEWSSASTEDYIKYTNLAPGRYTFKVRSCNNEGLWNSKETTFTFRIKTPFYRTWWFILICLFVCFSTIYLIFQIRIKNIKKKQKQDFERKVEMSKIELKALRSQMNPHFIFNSLNSIQHYIFNTKSDEAIKYLNKFARLVRTILNNSERPTVTVEDDIEALRLYLELEQMRFEEKFEYEIIIDKSVDTDYDIMPPLLMQPYVENAIIHGLNPKAVKGKLTIRLHSEKNFLICTITDNGIGREKSAEVRKTMPYKNHKSLGMKITEERLKILNEINNSQLSVTITDLKGINNESIGTQVKLFVPLSG